MPTPRGIFRKWHPLRPTHLWLDRQLREMEPLVRRLILWTIAWIVLAAPALVSAPVGFNRLAMLPGILLFILASVAITGTKTFAIIYGDGMLRSSIHAGVGIRLVLAAFCPMSIPIDLLVGVFSARVVQGLRVNPGSSGGTFALTIVQGLFITAEMALLTLLIYGAKYAWYWSFGRSREPQGFDVLISAKAIPVLKQVDKN